MDDNFSSIVKAVLWGRNVFDSIRKFLQFQLTVNLVAVTLAFIGSVTDDEGKSPLKPVQLLWVNLIMDTMAALALATDSPAANLLDRKPAGKNAELITNAMWMCIIGQSIFQLTVHLSVLYLGPWIFGVEDKDPVHITLIFNIFVMCQVFNEINCRKLGQDFNIFEGLFTNPICIGVLVFTMVFQYLIVEFGGEFASTHPLTGEQWAQCILLGALSIPVGYVIRLIPVPPEQSSESEVQLDQPKQVKSEVAQKAKIAWGKVKDATVQVQVLQTMTNPKVIESLRKKRTEAIYGF